MKVLHVASALAVALVGCGILAMTSSASDTPSRPGSKASYDLLPDGLRCGNSTFSLKELEASIEGANATRLLRVRDLRTRYQQSAAACGEVWYPGCDDVAAWNQQRLQPWPEDDEANDSARLMSDRARILLLDDLLALAAPRVMAHKYCYALANAPLDDDAVLGPCVALLEAEVKADASLLGDRGSRLQPPPAPTASAGKKVPTPADPRAGKGGPTPAGANPGGDTSKSPDAGSDALSAADVREFYKQLRAMNGKRTWSPTDQSVELWSAVRGVPASVATRSVAPLFAGAGTEEAALQANAASCPNAALYVGPNHTVIRRQMTLAATEPLTVCVDTASFALDEPVQLTVSSPSQKNVVLLWPGEPRAIPIELRPNATAEIVHLTVSGYPRTDLLRSLARHSGGPLAGTDAFALLKQAAAGAGQPTATQTASDLQSFLRQAQGSATLVEALGRVNDALEGKNDPVGMDGGRDATVADPTAHVPPSSPSDGVRNLVPLMQNAIDEEQKLLSLAPSSVTKAVTPLVPDRAQVGQLTSGSAARALAAKMGNFFNDINGLIQDAKGKDTSQNPNLDVIANQLCQLTTTVIPLVEEDLLVKPRDGASAPSPYVVEYDFAGGFLGSVEAGSLDEHEPIFVMVRNVRPGYSVAVSIDGHAVMKRDLQLIGLSQQAINFTASDSTSESRPGLDDLNPYQLEEQPPGTQIVALGTLVGGSRYTLKVCAVSGGGDCESPAPAATKPGTADGGAPGDGGSQGSPTAPASPHVIGLSTLTVHSMRRLGVRAGAGLTWDSGNFRDLVSEPNVTGNVVRQRANSWNFSLPVLLAVYVKARDSVGLPKQLSGGFMGGFDALKIGTTPRVYLGGVVDYYGFGVSVAFTEERISTIANPAGSIVNGNAQTDYFWAPGLFLGMTTDLDIFQAAFQQIFSNTGVPAVPDPSSP